MRLPVLLPVRSPRALTSSWSSLVLALALLLLIGPATAAAQPFSRGIVVTDTANGVKGGQTVDLDEDGDLDIVAALFFEDAIAWYENDGSGRFSKRIAASSVDGVEHVQPVDLDGDGDLDLLAGDQNPSGNNPRISWYENDGSESFTPHAIASQFGIGTEIQPMDVDVDGDVDVLALQTFTFGGTDVIGWFEHDATMSWPLRTIPSSIDGLVDPGDLDSDGDVDLLVASDGFPNTITWVENEGNQTFTEHVVTTNAPGVTDLRDVDLDGDGNTDILTSTRGFNNDTITWYRNDGAETFAQTVIPAFIDGPDQVRATDLDGDSDVDLLSAEDFGETIVRYENDGNESFAPHALRPRTTDQIWSLLTGDIDGDGNVDVISTDRNDDTIAWYENDPSVLFSDRSLTTSWNDAQSMVAADVDGDGDDDAVAAFAFGADAIAWYENRGGQPFVEHTVPTTSRPYDVRTTDLNGDGHTDLLGANADNVAWYENDGSQSFTERIVSSTAGGFGGAGGVFAVDMDGDGDIDVLCTDDNGNANNDIVWYENLGNGLQFTEHVVAAPGLNSPSDLFATDVDADGDLDVLASGVGSVGLAWYENVSNGYTEHVLTTTVNDVTSVVAADVDADGDMDVLTTSEAEHTVSWYENDGSLSFTRRVITSTAVEARSVFATDVDGDGNLDVLSASGDDGSGDDDKVAWYRNDGTGSFTTRLLSITIDGPTSVFASDVDGDGDTDVFSAAQHNGLNALTLHENVGSADPPNAAPTAVDDSYQTDEGQSLVVEAANGVLANDSDPDGDALTASFANSDPSNGTLTNPSDDGSFTYTPDAGFAGTDQFTYAADDGNGATTPATVTITVNDVNTPPTATDDSYSTPEGQTLTVDAPGVLANDSDPDGDALTASLDTDVSNGTLTFNPDGSFTYVPDAGFTGADLFTYEADDGAGNTSAATATINVDPAPITDDFVSIGAALTGVQGGSSNWGDVDGDGDPDLLITGESVTGSPTNPTFTATTVLYENDGTGGFSPSGAGLTAVTESSSAWGDFDDDGDLDLVVTGFDANGVRTAQIYENDGSGGLTPLGAGLTGVSAGTSDWADVDSDGDLDLLVTGFAGSGFPPTRSATLYENTGSGTFTPIGTTLTGVSGSSADFGDIDGDGDVDLVLTGEALVNGVSTRIARVYENDGDGTFTDTGAPLTPVREGSSQWGDVDGDDDLDLLLTGFAIDGSVTEIYENDGSGTFTVLPTTLPAVARGTADWGDIDNDETLDLILTGFDNEGLSVKRTTVYTNDGSGSFTALEDLLPVDASSTDWGDFDNDGDLDLVVTGADTTSLLARTTARVYENQIAVPLPECPLAWSLSLTGTDDVGSARAVTLGQSATASTGIDVECGEEELPPLPPNEAFNVRFVDTGLPGVTLGEGTARDIRPDGPAPTPTAATPVTWHVDVQTQDFPLTLTWDPSVLQNAVPNQPVRLVDVETGGDLLSVDMKQNGTVTLEAMGPSGVLVQLSPTVTRTLSVVEGWNLSSIPVQPDSATFGAVLPFCESAFAFEPGEGYDAVENAEPLTPGTGYFLNCAGGTAPITGPLPLSETVSVGEGWNLIGGFADSVAVEDVTSEPAELIVSNFFRYVPTSGYQVAGTVAPTTGYWVKTSGPGTLHFSAESGSPARALAHSTSASEDDPRSALRLTFTDATGRSGTLQFVPELDDEALDRYSVPPRPPGDLFDVRFASGHAAASLPSDATSSSPRVHLQGLTFPVRARLDASSRSAPALQLQTSDGTVTATLTSDASTAVLTDPVTQLRVGAPTLPTAITLGKSAPNPIAHAATIEYALPSAMDVTIEVYDVLGRRVARLVDGSQPAGVHRVQIEASRWPSGTYFYRMRAGAVVKTQRLTVVH